MKKKKILQLIFSSRYAWVKYLNERRPEKHSWNRQKKTGKMASKNLYQQNHLDDELTYKLKLKIKQLRKLIVPS